VSLDELLRCRATRSVEPDQDGDRLRLRKVLNRELRKQIPAYWSANIEHLRSAEATGGGHQRYGNRDRRNWIDEPSKDGCIRTICRKCGRSIAYLRGMT